MGSFGPIGISDIKSAYVRTYVRMCTYYHSVKFISAMKEEKVELILARYREKS